MTTKTKIIIVALLVAATIIVAVNVAKNTSKKEPKHKNSEISGIVNAFNEDTNIMNNNAKENNIIEENTLENDNNVVDTYNVVGKEEQGSISKNSSNDEESIAIELAQNEWGISISSYNFEATNKGNGIYEVSVINKTNRNVVTKYTVNTRLGTVVEAK